jgi:hypothetical protein
MHGGQRGAETDGATGEQDILDGREERLHLRCAAPCPAGNEEQDRHLVQVVGEMDRGAHVAAFGFRIGGILRRVERRLDARAEDAPVALGHPGAALGLADRDEEPGLAIAATGRERAGFADLANQLRRHRVRLEASDGARRADAFEQRQVFTDPVDRVHAERDHSQRHISHGDAEKRSRV